MTRKKATFSVPPFLKSFSRDAVDRNSIFKANNEKFRNFTKMENQKILLTYSNHQKGARYAKTNISFCPIRIRTYHTLKYYKMFFFFLNGIRV